MKSIEAAIESSYESMMLKEALKDVVVVVVPINTYRLPYRFRDQRGRSPIIPCVTCITLPCHRVAEACAKSRFGWSHGGFPAMMSAMIVLSLAGP